MTDTSGFYKLENNTLLCAPNFVASPTFELLREHHTEYTYPVDGWSWYDSELSANLALNPRDIPTPINAWGTLIYMLPSSAIDDINNQPGTALIFSCLMALAGGATWHDADDRLLNEWNATRPTVSDPDGMNAIAAYLGLPIRISDGCMVLA